MNLNLARKWRSKTFDEMVGQDLVIRMLKNSLYLNHFFPVYLFSGQRGCGKTTAARIFAAAVNCQNLNLFRQDPKSHTLPCLCCDACLAMASGKHPDFIEIDAASHTGVDHVRQIIDAASLLPVMGIKKIYLIDEAHMLSKAAFNAFLKILEEPPTSVFFMLATTDAHKIIETVLSRSFQLLFKSIEPQCLYKHLSFICDQEKISFTLDGITEIAQNCQGSVRDALNLLEQVRFSSACVDQQAVWHVLGKLRSQDIIEILEIALFQPAVQLAQALRVRHIENYNPFDIWRSCIQLLSDVAWLTVHAPIKHQELQSSLTRIAQQCTFTQIASYLDIFYQHESLLQKTKTPHTLLEYVLLKLSKNNISTITKSLSEPTKIHVAHSSPNSPLLSGAKWQQFIEKIESTEDPLLLSVFKRAQLQATHHEHIIIISFPENLTFFKDIIERTQKIWLTHLHMIYGNHAQLQYTFNAMINTNVIQESSHGINTQPTMNTPNNSSSTIYKKEAPAKKQEHYKQITKYPERKKNPVIEKSVNISDTSKWIKTRLILEVFPGSVTEINEDTYD